MGLVLSQPEENITASRSLDPGLKAPVSVEKNDCPAVLGAFLNQSRAKHYVAEADNATQVVERHLKSKFTILFHFKRLVIKVRVHVGSH